MSTFREPLSELSISIQVNHVKITYPITEFVGNVAVYTYTHVLNKIMRQKSLNLNYFLPRVE